MVPASMTKQRLSKEAKDFVGRDLLGVHPDDQHTGVTQEPHQPIECRLMGLERAPPPINQRHVVLTGRMATICRCCCTTIAPVMQLKHQFDALGTSYQDWCCCEQHASAIIGSMIRSPAGVAREAVMTSPLGSGIARLATGVSRKPSLCV